MGIFHRKPDRLFDNFRLQKKYPTFEKAYFIKKVFLDKSQYEVNTSQKIINEVNLRLEHYSGMHVYAKHPAGDIFDAVLKDAKLNVTDTLTRFYHARMKHKLGILWLYKVPVGDYFNEIPSHIDLLRQTKEVGFQLSSALAV